VILAIVTMGEGWHNNHHAYQSSARQGFRWWEIDLTYYILRALALVGIVWDLKSPPTAVLRNEHRLSARVLQRTAERLAASFDPEATARVIQSVQPSEAADLAQRLVDAREPVIDKLAALPTVPRRQDFVRQAQRLFAQTQSIDEIVDQAGWSGDAAIGSARDSSQLGCFLAAHRACAGGAVQMIKRGDLGL
jgi:stearoyl-CoA desaturase (delta-9 desaturase)